MLKAAVEDADGHPGLVLGLTHENLEALMSGEPCGFGLTEIGLPNVRITVQYAHDDESLVRMWAASGRLPPGSALDVMEAIRQRRKTGRMGQVFGEVDDDAG